ncbi:MAG: 30S ribosomal protein S12 methylthiotransferase RimO [Blastocatellia bacterium]|nr:30S ribosomal protein S12 methylthiotransferase RimO [Blastocatellia bacterium]MCS7157892.1 30S ribosomal protein S12 methylthiotransferase RimO [Blastocatellia bacterium]MCX7753371.1 30S ribosomal protein S12 methylthiotransferase RimO [Blastocatellia bacterium]MDW8168030.1 30S ribosomal protein S12 methylthiotransferase RimO [Acidobacteriota bacterium]MDW8255770.1 30S ribosomal protein S12 methylthiotransferase RimO [Acidobacteriota bacterium]
MPKVGWISLGCPKNLVDSEVMMGWLVREGFALTTNVEEAEILVVNTCAFIDPARRESIETILEMAQWKERGRCRKLIVTGCLVERYGDQLRRALPEVDAILGTRELERVVEICREGEEKRRKRSLPVLSAEIASRYVEGPTHPRLLTTPRPTAYLKIAEGCDHTCSFCIIPKLRGLFRSRPLESLLKEAEELAARGVRELVLVAQDTTHYGVDIGMREGLATLLRALARIEGIRWIRFLYSYPNHVSDALIETVATEEKVCPYFDIPLQHVSARLLRAMRRGGTRRSLERLIERIRRRLPEATLRTTFIVGFPGETEQDFRELLDFCRSVEFDYAGAFLYSDEEGTEAYGLTGKVPSSVARARQRRLLRELERIAQRRHRRWIGRTVEVLVEGYVAASASSSDDRTATPLVLRGRMAAQAPEIDGGVILDVGEAKQPPRPGEFVQVEILDVFGSDLIGRVRHENAC